MSTVRNTACRRRGSGGFTLVELAIAVSVIGILAAIAIPNYLNAADRARRGSCFSNQRHVSFAATLYCADTGTQEGVLSSLELHGLGYCPDGVAECPSSDTSDFDDYEVTIVAGEVQAISCLIGGAGHAMPL